MIERLLENWLIRANERSFQIPFCHWLAFSGHTVIHMSRHCAMEMGKDILTIGPDGVPCAYQLKGADASGKISLSTWRNDLGKQVYPLVLGKIVHPSIPIAQHHRAYIVINGELEEEVIREIDDFNQSLLDDGRGRRLGVIVRGELLKNFKDLQSDLWVSKLPDLKTYLELYLEDGNGQLPKQKLATIFESVLPFDTDDGKAPARNAAVRAVAGCAIICASSISAFTNAKNHLVEFEAWTMFFGYVLGLVERWRCPPQEFRFATDVALEAMYSALGRLCDELIDRDSYAEVNVLADRFVYEVRMTHLLGLMGIYGLWRAQEGRSEAEEDDRVRQQFLRRFSSERAKSMQLWGEYAVPQFLAHNFFRRTFDPTPATDFLYHSLIETILNLNGSGGGKLPNPYYDAESYLPYAFKLEPEPVHDSFRDTSFYLEGLLHLFVRANKKQHTRWIFPDITRFGLRRYVPGAPWRFYFFQDRSGKSYQSYMQPPHRWQTLRELAIEDQGVELPPLIKDYPIAYLCLLCVYPHRVSANGLRWLSTRLLNDT